VIAYSVNMIQRHRTYHEVIHELDRNKPVKKGSNVKKTPKEKQKNLKLLKITNKMSRWCSLVTDLMHNIVKYNMFYLYIDIKQISNEERENKPRLALSEIGVLRLSEMFF
jgi:hypothetical protein